MSASFLVNGSIPTGAILLTAGATVTLSLADTSGAATVEWEFVGASEATTYPAITITGRGMASFTAPAAPGHGNGLTMVLQCRNNGSVATALLGVGSTTQIAAMENQERGTGGAWLHQLNNNIRTATAAGVPTFETPTAFRASAELTDGTVFRIVSPPGEYRYSTSSGAGWADDGDTILKPDSVLLSSNGRGFSTRASQHAATFAAAAAMRGLLGRAKHVHIESHTTFGDGGGGVFDVKAVGSYVADGGTIITAGDAALIRRGRVKARINVASFGASASASRSTNRSAFANALAALLAFGGGTLELPDELLPIEPATSTAPCIHVSFGGVSVVGLGIHSGIQVFNDADVPILVATNPDLSIAPTGTTIDGFEMSSVRVVGTGHYTNYALAYGRGVLLRNVKNASVHHCRVDDMSMIGICSEGACGNLDIHHNIIQDCLYTGVNFNGRAYASKIASNIITGATGDVNACGIQADGPCVIEGNTVFGGGAYGGGILWGEGDWHGIGAINGNVVTHCSYGVKAFYHGGCGIGGNTIINCYGLGGGILVYGGTTTGFTVPISNARVHDNTVVNCGPYQIEITAENTVVANNQVWRISSPVNVASSGAPDYIDTVVTVDTGITVRANGVSVVGNTIDGAIRGVSYLLGTTPGTIAGNTYRNCTNNVVQEAPAKYLYTVVPDIAREQVGSTHVTRMMGTSAPTAGYFDVGSVWEDSTPEVGRANKRRVSVAWTTTTAATAAAGDTTITTAASSTLRNNSVIGIELDNGALHWSLVTSSSGTTTTFATAIPVGRSVANGADVFANSWITESPSIAVPFLLNKPTGTSGLVGSPGASTVLPLLTEDTSTGSHYHQGPYYAYSSGKYATFHVMAKASGRNCITLSDGGSNGATFNISTGVIVSTVGTVEASIVDLGGGVYDCHVTCLWSSAQTYIYLSVDGSSLSYTGTNQSVIILKSEIIPE